MVGTICCFMELLLNKKVNTSADAIKRFENRKEGKGASEKEK